MIRVTVERLPGGDPRRAEPLDVVTVSACERPEPGEETEWAVDRLWPGAAAGKTLRDRAGVKHDQAEGEMRLAARALAALADREEAGDDVLAAP